MNTRFLYVIKGAVALAFTHLQQPRLGKIVEGRDPSAH